MYGGVAGDEGGSFLHRVRYPRDIAIGVTTQLIVWERDGRVEKVRVPDEGLTIGRKPSPYGASYCTVNSAVSRLHCRLARLGDGWFIEDLGSQNGTNINGELAEGPTPLRAGDVIV